MNSFENIDCQSFLQRLESDHARVNVMLRQLKQICESAGMIPTFSVSPRQELVDHMNQLRTELAKHFQEEEEGGCMEEAACRCPSLSGEVSRLEAQHAALLSSLDQLVKKVRDGKCAIASQEFSEFEQALRDHEEHEERVVRHGFNVA